VLSLVAFEKGLAKPDEPHHFEACLEQKMHAMAVIRKNLSDGRLALSDANIAAVFNLVCLEEKIFLYAVTLGQRELRRSPALVTLVRSSLQTRTAHMNGLKRMIEVRGGIPALNSLPVLQLYFIRWSVKARSVPLLMAIPDQKVGEGQVAAGHSAKHAFIRPIPIPEGLAMKIYNYPACSRFLHVESRMSTACGRAGMSAEAVRLIRTTDCLVWDLSAWISSAKGHHEHGWDVITAQNLCLLHVDTIANHYMESESSMSAAEAVTILCLWVLGSYVSIVTPKVFNAQAGTRGRLARLFLDPGVRSALQAASVDVWVALLVLMLCKGGPESREFLIGVAKKMLSEKRPPIRTFEDVYGHMRECIWFSGTLDDFARETWRETCGDW
jgi:hypothetical protein